MSTPEQWAKTLKETSWTNPEDFYNLMAQDYENTVQAWGYTMPRDTAALLVKLFKNDSLSGSCVLRILDVGCGDGLVADELAKLDEDVELDIATPGESDKICSKMRMQLTGLDISQKMLDLALPKNKYFKLIKTDASSAEKYDPNVIPSDHFDGLVCVGTTSYLKTAVMRDWIRTMKSSGLAVFTCKTASWREWEAAMEELVTDGLWKHVHTSDLLNYLPHFDEKAKDERVKIYAYRKC